MTVADAKSMWNQAGRMGTGVIQGKTVLMPMSYDGGAGWHGPGISMVLPADSNGHSGAKNFTFEFRNYIEGDNIDMGDTEFVVTAKDVSGRRYHLAGIAFWKTQYGSPTGNVSVYSLGKQKKIFQTSFRNNANLYYTNHSITKFGDTLTFEVCGQKIWKRWRLESALHSGRITKAMSMLWTGCVLLLTAWKNGWMCQIKWQPEMF